MESIFTALKLLGPMLLTPLINRFISTFRIRQLYLSFDEVLPCVLPDAAGFVACMHIYNKGKDKETKVEVGFFHTSQCQVLASNYVGVSVEGNKILIDRILPRQTVILNVYMNSTMPISSVFKPTIKSEDANGKAYDGRGNVPPSLGPAVMGVSFITAALITFFYIVFSGTNVLYPYYALRYSSLMAQGVTPSGFSDNFLISKAGFTSTSPISLMEPYVEGSKIILPLKIKNISDAKIKITVFHDLNDEGYKREREKASAEIPDISKRVDAWQLIDEKYGYSAKDDLYISDVLLDPREEKIVLLVHTVLVTTTLENFNFSIHVEKGVYEDSSFRDYYNFDIEDYEGRLKILEFMRALKH